MYIDQIYTCKKKSELVIMAFQKLEKLGYVSEMLKYENNFS